MKHTAIYLRVSSVDQNTASQKADLEHIAAQASGEVSWYEDHFTGKEMTRPSFTILLKRIRAGEITRVIVWRLDRLGRTASGLTALFDELTERGVGFTSIRDGLDLSTPAGRLLANVLASVAQYETEVRAERQRAGIAAAQARGQTWGGSKKGRVIKVTTEVTEAVRDLAQRGYKKARIARMVHLSRATIRSILSRE